MANLQAGILAQAPTQPLSKDRLRMPTLIHPLRQQPTLAERYRRKKLPAQFVRRSPREALRGRTIPPNKLTSPRALVDANSLDICRSRTSVGLRTR